MFGTVSETMGRDDYDRTVNKIRQISDDLKRKVLAELEEVGFDQPGTVFDKEIASLPLDKKALISFFKWRWDANVEKYGGKWLPFDSFATLAAEFFHLGFKYASLQGAENDDEIKEMPPKDHVVVVERVIISEARSRYYAFGPYTIYEAKMLLDSGYSFSLENETNVKTIDARLVKLNVREEE